VASLHIEMPEDLVRRLELIATAESKTLEQVAVERLRSSIDPVEALESGTPAALLRALREPPHPTAADVQALEAAIAGGRAPIHLRELFPD
jgi:hypothetical protein